MSKREHNNLIKAITIVAVIMAILSALCLDSESWIPVIVLAICSGWLLLFTIANCTEQKYEEGDIWDEVEDKVA